MEKIKAEKKAPVESKTETAAKKIVEEHRGTVNLKSEIGKGTEFEICLPLNSK